MHVGGWFYSFCEASSSWEGFSGRARHGQVSDPSSSKLDVELSQSALLEVLSQALLEEIFNRLENASAIASASCVCRSFKEAGRRVRSARLICLNKYHEDARAGSGLHDAKAEASTSNAVAAQGAPEGQQQQAMSIGDDEGSSSGDEYSFLVFRDVVVDFVREKPHLQQLRIEIESRLQSKTVPVPERRRTDFWLSDPFHLMRWVPSVQATLQHLCIVDYGQQAIMRRTSILKILSQNCKVLKTLDLRNMFIDSSEVEDMPRMTSFTLRCVKVIGDTLQHINARMRNLTTLALLGVFGVTHGNLDFPSMKVLCLGLSTIAKDVSIDIPSLVKLQLKIMCPEKLTINAASLKFMAFNLEVKDAAKVEMKNLHNLQEVLYGASSFATLWSLVATNQMLSKLFLDIPCMALGEDGKWLGVLKNIPLALPTFKNLLLCQKLAVLNIGPGLWHAMEVNLEELSTVQNWPPFNRLIIHMIPQNLDACLAILQLLLKPTLNSLEMYIHINSPVSYEAIVSQVTDIVPYFGQGLVFRPQLWKKSLNFSCFSF
ncbi:hypothetical protein M758_4G143700 [Ceratodon purpureus]|nr:hypothetical protein M758_4G143700 [Ceratodon purpureus]